MLLLHNRETQKEKYIVVKKLKKRESKAMTKQIKNIFFSDEEKKLYLDNLHDNKELWYRAHTMEKTRDRADGEFQRDYSRIMYASSFRRLQGKMQLLGIKPDQFFRNRLTHSLEVAQIARSIAYELGYSQEESFVVEAGALAHDIGNPPFGHSGERKLHELFEHAGGFEGNAQTLRILTSVEKKKKDFQGLNLTYRTMLSVVKYFHKYKEGNSLIYKKFIYDDDYNLLNDFVKENHIIVRTLDVQIVDIADEIAYAAHDLEDGLRQKCYTIDEILQDFYNKYGNCDSFKRLEKIVKKCKKVSGYKTDNIDSSISSKLFRQELSSMLIHTLINDLGFIKITEEEKAKRGSQFDKELGFKEYGDLAHGLKKITYSCINHNDAVYTYEKKGDIILERLVEFYRDNTLFLPPEYRVENFIHETNEDKKMLQERLICDYISGMMDSYAISQYEKITGEQFSKIVL